MKKIILICLTVTIGFSQTDNNNGKLIYMKNGCYGCHGVDAKGDKDYPSLAGKSKNYLINKLKLYKNEQINSNRSNIMKPFAKALSNREIENLAEYISNINKKSKTPYYYHEYEVGDSAGS